MALKKNDLIKILVDEYGYEKEDLKFDANGKPYTNAKLQALIDQEEEDAKELASASKVKPQFKKEKKINESEMIDVMNGLTGALVYHSERTNRKWEFENFGDKDTISYGELLAMRNKYPRFFTEGWLVVLDERVQEEFKLKEMYENIITPENEDDIFKMEIEDLDVFIDKLPDGMKTSLVNKAIEKYENGTLDSNKVIKHIQNKFNFSLEDNAPLDNIVSTAERDRNNVIIVNR